MYQGIFFDYENWDCYVRDDIKGINSFKYQLPVYKLNENGEYTTLFGDKCSLYKGKYSKEDNTILEKDINREIAVLRDLYYKTDNIPSYHNLLYLDIEIEILGTLTPQYIKNCPAKITAIALIDVNTKTKYCYVLDNSNELDIEEEGKIIISCKNEKQLLLKFLEKWKEIDPTIVISYNGDFFDIPYLYYRMKKIIGNKTYELSPIGKIKENLAQPYSPITLGLISSLDYMLLLKKYIMKEEPSYKLGDIGSKYAKLGKIEYNGSLDKLFKEDKNKFIDYNLRDVEIIEALEEKQKFIQLTILISHLCHTPYEYIYYNTMLNEGAILTYLKRKNIISPNKPTTTNPSIKELNKGDEIIHQRGTPTIEGIIVEIDEYLNKAQIQLKSGMIKERSLRSIRKKDGYAGGFLLDPIPGLYSYVSDLDYTSLYPSIIKSLNLGIETLIGRIITKNNYEKYNSLEKLKELNPNEKIEIEKLNKDNYILKKGTTTVGNLISIIENNKYTISASGAIFRTDIDSISCIVLKDWFKQREYYRGLKKKSGKDEDWENYKLYDLYQLAFKILQNALYGTYAINGWRYTDGYKICSAAITNSGQRLTEESIFYVDKIIEEELQLNKKYIIASDTDSMYIEIKDILNKRFPNIIDENDKIKKLIEISQELQIKANKNLDNISQYLFNINSDHYFELKQEVIIKSACWSGKRRYAMWVINKEGVDVDELDMKGLDIMKSNFPPFFREFGENIIKKILFGSNKEEINNYILNFKNNLETVDWKKLLKPTGLKKLNEYIAKKSNEDIIFSELHKKCPINTKAAIITNDLLKYHKIDTNYSTFQIGDKINIAYLKPNPYNIEVIGLNGYDDSPIILELVEKYIDKSKLFDSVIKNKIETIFEDLGWGGVIFNQNVNKFFTF